MIQNLVLSLCLAKTLSGTMLATCMARDQDEGFDVEWAVLQHCISYIQRSLGFLGETGKHCEDPEDMLWMVQYGAMYVGFG